MNTYRHTIRIASHSRRGSIQPAIAFALLVIGAAAALVLGSLWKDAATVELHNVAEAAALAAAGEYLSDPILSENFDGEQAIEWAQIKAAQVAGQNFVAGQPFQLQIGPQGNVQFGFRNFIQLGITAPWEVVTSTPNVVAVQAGRTRRQGNPIGLFFAGVTGRGDADAISTVEVAFDNHIQQFRPTPGLTIPAFPIAILGNDPTKKRTDTWQVQIEQRLGADEWSFDEVNQQVVQRPDGIPEMVLTSVPIRGDVLSGNVQLLDFHNDLQEQAINQQIMAGINPQDLQDINGVLPAHTIIPFTGLTYVTSPVQETLESMIGQPRLILLYQQTNPLSVPGWTETVCQGVVAVRILLVETEADEQARITIQPTVLTTKTAELSLFSGAAEDDRNGEQEPEFSPPANRYVYKIYVHQ